MIPRLRPTLPTGKRLLNDRPRAVADLQGRAVLEDLESDVVVRRIAPRESQALLHRGLDLDLSAVGGHGVVYGSLGGGQRDRLVLHGQHFADVADQAAIKRKVAAVLAVAVRIALSDTPASAWP